jgi:hypothetical protein
MAQNHVLQRQIFDNAQSCYRARLIIDNAQPKLGIALSAVVNPLKRSGLTSSPH